MLKNFRDKIALSGVTVLLIGVSLLVFTFLSAYGFLSESLSIIASEDLVRTFGEALAPLIGTCIRIMYLGVMGWIGSLITIRGVTIIAHAPQTPVTTLQKEAVTESKPQAQPQPQKKVEKPKIEQPKEEKPKEEPKKPEAKPPEPQFVVIPPEEVAQPQPPQNQPEQNKSSPPQQPSS